MASNPPLTLKSFLEKIEHLVKRVFMGLPRIVLRNMDIIHPLNIVTDDLSTVIGLTDEEQNGVIKFLEPLQQQHKLLIGFHPVAGTSTL